MKSILSSILFFALAALGTALEAQEPTRVRGTISALDGNVLSVTSGGGKKASIQLADKTVIVFTQPITLADCTIAPTVALVMVWSSRPSKGRWPGLTGFGNRRTS